MKIVLLENLGDTVLIFIVQLDAVAYMCHTWLNPVT